MQATKLSGSYRMDMQLGGDLSGKGSVGAQKGQERALVDKAIKMHSIKASLQQV